MAAKAIEVARYFIELAAAEEEEDRLSPLRLQKLLYYAQGWSLVLRNKPLFEESIKAWQHGPAVPTVWHAFKQYGSGAIDPQDVPPAKLDDESKGLIRAVWHAYRGFSAISLREMTHREPPWAKAAARRKPDAPWTVEISRSTMRVYFLSLQKQAS